MYHFACQLRSIDHVMSIKKAKKVSSIPRSILLYESIVDIDIDTSKVSSILSISISIFDITNPACRQHIMFLLWISVLGDSKTEGACTSVHGCRPYWLSSHSALIQGFNVCITTRKFINKLSTGVF